MCNDDRRSSRGAWEASRVTAGALWSPGMEEMEGVRWNDTGGATAVFLALRMLAGLRRQRYLRRAMRSMAGMAEDRSREGWQLWIQFLR
jgi:hypothetical protein